MGEAWRVGAAFAVEVCAETVEVASDDEDIVPVIGGRPVNGSITESASPDSSAEDPDAEHLPLSDIPQAVTDTEASVSTLGQPRIRPHWTMAQRLGSTLQEQNEDRRATILKVCDYVIGTGLLQFLKRRFTRSRDRQLP